MRGMSNTVYLSLGILLAALIPACASQSAEPDPEEAEDELSPGAGNAPSADIDDPGDHGANGDWVECPRRTLRRAADPTGPVIAHGFREAPGFRPGLLNTAQQRFLARAELHRPVDGFLFYENLTLPVRDPDHVQVAELVTGAILLSGLTPPASIVVSSSSSWDEEERTTRRAWELAFEHDGIRVSGGRCQLSIEEGAFRAALSCRIPAVTRPLRFEPFRVTDAAALQTAVSETRVSAVHHDVQRLYVIDGSRARARVQVVHTNTRQEMLTVVDGRGALIGAGRNDRDFVFRGYDFDYVDKIPQIVSTQVDPGNGQTTALDTAHLESPTGKASCPTGPLVGAYSTGFVICFNDALLDPEENPPTLTQPLVAPRNDGDYTNPANAPNPTPASIDPLGPQIVYTQLDYNTDFGTSFVPHGNRGDLPALPAQLPTQLIVYQRIAPHQPQEQPIGPAHQAELQAFSNAGRQLRFYELLDSRFTVAGQDRFRTTLTVHWRPATANDPDFPITPDDYNNARAGRYVLKFGDVKRSTVVSDNFALELTSDGSVFAHEYQHHIQESLAKDNDWSGLSADELFDPTGTCQNAACRRTIVLEGLADGFASLHVNRGVVGTLNNPDQPLATQLDACDDKSAYGAGAVGPPLASNRTRALCNNAAFGLWDEIETAADSDECTRPATAATQFGQAPRQYIIAGATYQYGKRFLDDEKGPLVPARHLLEAERYLQGLEDGERTYYAGLLQYLSSSPFASVRRYQYTALASFAEKGIFPGLVHQLTTSGSDPDERPKVECNVGTCNFFTTALTLTQGALTMSGPFTWNSASQAPEFDLFAVPGNAYGQITLGGATANLVWLELSDNAAFDASQGTFVRQPAGFAPNARINCSPRGFFRSTPFAATWQTVANAALQGQSRVYYRVRQCLAGQGPDSGFCIVSTRSSVPAYVVLDPPGPGGGCQCRASGGSTDPSSLILLLAPLLAWLRRRGRKS